MLTFVYGQLISNNRRKPNLSGINPGRNIEQESDLVKSAALIIPGIDCPTDCSCYDSTIRDLALEGRQMYAKIVELAHKRL